MDLEGFPVVGISLTYPNIHRENGKQFLRNMYQITLQRLACYMQSIVYARVWCLPGNLCARVM